MLYPTAHANLNYIASFRLYTADGFEPRFGEAVLWVNAIVN